MFARVCLIASEVDQVLDWDSIDTVLLDMDGTLLDLHFDNHFWLEFVPHKYAELKGIALRRLRLTVRLKPRRLQVPSIGIV